jgi:hypothetical protein
MALSFLISFLAQVVFTALKDQKAVDFIPGFSDFSSLFLNVPVFTVSDITSNIGRFTAGPGIATILAFALRQMNHDSRTRKGKKPGSNPGARILLLFMWLVAAVLIADAFSIILEPDNQNQKSVQPKDQKEHVILSTVNYFMPVLTQYWFYTDVIITWIFDRFIFSSLWVQDADDARKLRASTILIPNIIDMQQPADYQPRDALRQNRPSL